ncbi:MAG TPA: PRC-barrel domain-containing protein [Amaricoccus sp.]|uniref:PRC-barrel domain-containing protein n=1 Tax=Amaricoccus sp. TaxID=1872485 RepID=UPI002C1E7729|nr:PRC-barrel domain-containing protein [Amaricoccus sp.]HMR52044.1 PRC-barrel domain-containing protein [Amaricoccus sp.]HMR59714.1 PRC-barrel domain-containing protein [Amaricoccus sp.]HMT98846.1 PRC-barrel domain-containing protein [Amaricoccus sp.]
MFKTLFATTALGALLATGAFAQTATETTDPAADPAAPVIENETTPAEVMEGDDPAMAAEEAAPVGDPAMVAIPEGWVEMDPSTLSAENLIGADIKTYGGDNVASIDDVLLSDDGKVENVAATFGGFLGFGSDTVLLSMEELDIIKDANDVIEVRTTLTPESLEGREPYEG